MHKNKMTEQNCSHFNVGGDFKHKFRKRQKKSG